MGILKTKSIRSKKETGKSIIIFFEYFYSYDMKMIINDKMLLLFVMGKIDLLQKKKKKKRRKYIHAINKSKTRKRKMIHQYNRAIHIINSNYCFIHSKPDLKNTRTRCSKLK